MTPAEASHALRALARRVGRLKPLNHDPEKFFVDRGEIEAELLDCARKIDPSHAARVAPAARVRFSSGSVEVNGRTIVAAVRRRLVRSQG